MEDMLFYDRIQFAFTITFHYLFPQLTMGLSMIIVFLKWRSIRTKDRRYNDAAKFLMRIFAINFMMGVITGIPMEFQFGTNWAKFSELTGDIIGQTLAMEGMFSFFLESSFLALFIFGEKWLGQRLHFLTAFLVFLGSWASGFFILATNAWMQHPVGYEIVENGKYVLTHFSALFGNPWLLPAFLHNQLASLVTSSFVVGGIGAYYLLRQEQVDSGKLLLKTGIIFGVVSTVLVAFPTGDWAAKNMVKYQPASFAAMEGIFKTEGGGTEIVLIGQPNMLEKEIDNKIAVPGVLSFLTYRDWDMEIKGMDAFEKDQLPTNVPALYYAYHMMVGLGTLFIGLMLMGLFYWVRGKIYNNKFLLWMIMFATPFPYLANIAGWFTAEMGRQPWLVYGLLRTDAGVSPTVSSGNTLFTLLGFMGLYLLLGLLFFTLVMRIINQGPKV